MSLLYIIYQSVQFFASIIGPGSIFLMLNGALSLVLKTDDITLSLILNLIPISIFVFTSFFVDESTQVRMES